MEEQKERFYKFLTETDPESVFIHPSIPNFLKFSDHVRFLSLNNKCVYIVSTYICIVYLPYAIPNIFLCNLTNLITHLIFFVQPNMYLSIIRLSRYS